MDATTKIPAARRKLNTEDRGLYDHFPDAELHTAEEASQCIRIRIATANYCVKLIDAAVAKGKLPSSKEFLHRALNATRERHLDGKL